MKTARMPNLTDVRPKKSDPPGKPFDAINDIKISKPRIDLRGKTGEVKTKEPNAPSTEQDPIKPTETNSKVTSAELAKEVAALAVKLDGAAFSPSLGAPEKASAPVPVDAVPAASTNGTSGKALESDVTSQIKISPEELKKLIEVARNMIRAKITKGTDNAHPAPNAASNDLASAITSLADQEGVSLDDYLSTVHHEGPEGLCEGLPTDNSVLNELEQKAKANGLTLKQLLASMQEDTDAAVPTVSNSVIGTGGIKPLHEMPSASADETDIRVKYEKPQIGGIKIAHSVPTVRTPPTKDSKSPDAGIGETGGIKPSFEPMEGTSGIEPSYDPFEATGGIRPTVSSLNETGGVKPIRDTIRTPSTSNAPFKTNAENSGEIGGIKVSHNDEQMSADVNQISADTKSDQTATDALKTLRPTSSNTSAPATWIGNDVAKPVANSGSFQPTSSRSAKSLSATDVAQTVRQLTDRIELLAAARPKGGVVVHLQPAHLGSVTLSVKNTGGAIETEISASNENVRTALEQNHSLLSRALEQKGFNLESVTVKPQAESSQTNTNAQNRDASHQQQAQSQRSSHHGMNYRNNVRGNSVVAARRQLTTQAAGVDYWI